MKRTIKPVGPVLALTLLTAVVATPVLQASAASEVYGAWEMMNVERNGMHYEIVMTIEKDRVRMTSSCSHEGNLVEAVVSSAARITADQLQITETDRDEKEFRPGYLQCRATIKPMQVSYTIEDGKLVLTDPQRPKPLVLTRIDR